MEEKDEVLEYMKNKEWTKENKIESKKYLVRMAQSNMKSKKLENKIGGVLILNQIIEQLLKEVIISSIAYIKAEIWPSEVELSIQISKATLGKLIDFFKKFAIKKCNREVLINLLEKLLIYRNKLVHNLFDLKDEKNICEELIEYDNLSESIIELLIEYYNEISEQLFELDKRVNFDLI